MAKNQEINVGKQLLTDEKCHENFEFWSKRLRWDGTESELFKSIFALTSKVYPAHTFAYDYLKGIFEYNEKERNFNPSAKGLIAQAFRKSSLVPDRHMKTSKELGHDIFLFSYLGVHNPYQRLKDNVPVRPFGLFIKKEIEEFPFCHGAPCDVAHENSEVIRDHLDKYYLLPLHLRQIKAFEIETKPVFNKNFWYYFGDPDSWMKEEDYGKRLFYYTGEMRYLKQISVSSIAAILWPFFVDIVLPDGTTDMDQNLELFTAFKMAFPDISIIHYNHDIDYQQNWEITLVEASFYSYKFYLKNGYFPKSANIAKQEIKHDYGKD
jgi:hypothetical protein